MIYTVQYPKGRMNVDTDKIARTYLADGELHVRTFAEEDRIKLVEYLESEGFRCITDAGYSRQGILDSRLPLKIVLDEKSISRMGNVTCAAAAAGTGIIMSDRDFYLLYSLYWQLRQESGLVTSNRSIIPGQNWSFMLSR